MSGITLTVLLVFACLCGSLAGDSSQDVAPGGTSSSDSSAAVYQPSEQTVTGTVHSGCVPFQDPEDMVSKGPITQVEILHGGFIHGIRLCYGQDGQGLFHLGPREDEVPGRTLWSVPEGERIVRIEGGIAGAYVSRLRFFTDRGTASPQFGGTAGKPFVVTEPGIGGLRTISGQVNKKRTQRAPPVLAFIRKEKPRSTHRAITSMTFHFGAPYYIKDITYDLAALEAASLKAVPERLAQQEIPNRTTVEQAAAYTDTKTVTTTKTLTFKLTAGLKFGGAVSVGLPGMVGVEANFEVSASTESGNSYGNTSTQEVSWSVPVRVPPGKRIVAVSTVKRYRATVPFTYTVAWYWGTRNNVLKEITLPGVYEGVHVEDLKHEFRELPLE